MAGAASHRQGTGGGAPRRQPAAGDAKGLAIEGLALARGMRVIQPSLTHRMAAGEITLVTGPNGSGKSTLLRTVAGRLRPLAGSVACDVPMLYVGHADGLAPALSGRRNLSATGPGSMGSPPRRNGSTPRWHGLARARLPNFRCGFSRAGSGGGWRWRGWRCRQGALWLLDEPTAGLDDASRQAVDALIAEHLAAGGMVMAATHDPLAPASGPRELALEAAP